MVKQGEFASSTRSMRGKSQRYKVQSGQGKINPENVAEYVMVRYHLTRGKKQSALVEQVILRLLERLVPEVQSNSGNLTSALRKQLKQASVSVPWQYYKVIANEWPMLVKWLKKELPSVPLDEKILLQDEVENAAEMFAQQLAINWWLAQSAGNTQRLASVTEHKINSLAETFVTSESINWQVVQTIYSTVQFTPSESLDQETKTWLNELAEMV